MTGHLKWPCTGNGHRVEPLVSDDRLRAFGTDGGKLRLPESPALQHMVLRSTFSEEERQESRRGWTNKPRAEKLTFSGSAATGRRHSAQRSLRL